MRVSDYVAAHTIFHDRYILCRSVGGPVKTDALIFAVEDQDGRMCVQLSLLAASLGERR